VRVLRATAGGGAWVEPAAWARLDGLRRRRGDAGLTIEDVALADVRPGDGDLLHVAGVAATAWSDAELSAVRGFAEAGGRVLIETIGGRGDFAGSWVEAWRAYNDRPVRAWHGATPGHALRQAGYGSRWWRGKDQGDTPSDGRESTSQTGGETVGEALLAARWRQSTSIDGLYESRPAFEAVHIGDRAGIVISHTDLTLGGLGVRSDEVVGVDPASATRLLDALLTPAEPAAPTPRRETGLAEVEVE